jgi:hypothetical protein
MVDMIVTVRTLSHRVNDDAIRTFLGQNAAEVEIFWPPIGRVSQICDEPNGQVVEKEI